MCGCQKRKEMVRCREQVHPSFWKMALIGMKLKMADDDFNSEKTGQCRQKLVSLGWD